MKRLTKILTSMILGITALGCVGCSDGRRVVVVNDTSASTTDDTRTYTIEDLKKEIFEDVEAAPHEETVSFTYQGSNVSIPIIGKITKEEYMTLGKEKVKDWEYYYEGNVNWDYVVFCRKNLEITDRNLSYEGAMRDKVKILSMITYLELTDSPNGYQVYGFNEGYCNKSIIRPYFNSSGNEFYYQGSFTMTAESARNAGIIDSKAGSIRFE